MSFVCLVVLALLQLRRMELNCFELLEVDRNVKSSELSKSVRKRAALFHPDKPSDPNLELPFGFSNKDEVFLQLQKCQETLTSANKFSHYNRFGKLDFAYKNEASLIPVMAVFAVIGYLANFIVCTIFTAAPESQASRYWIYSYLLFAMAAELYLKFLGQTGIFDFIPYFSNWLVFEQVEAIKTLIPSMLSSGVLLSQLSHVDDSEMYHEILQAVSNSNRDIANHIVGKRLKIAESAPIVPAVIKLMQGPQTLPQPPRPAPSGGVNVSENQTDKAPGQKTVEGSSTSSGISFQRILNWLFYAYLIKVVVNSIRSLL
jgi:hypothetical protein